MLLRSIVGLRRPTEGEVRVFGQDLLSLPEAQRSLIERRFGVLFQQGALFSSLTVTENIAMPLIEHAGLSRPDAEHLALVKLALAGLPDPPLAAQVLGVNCRPPEKPLPVLVPQLPPDSH